jgi:hypothetical protein
MLQLAPLELSSDARFAVTLMVQALVAMKARRFTLCGLRLQEARVAIRKLPRGSVSMRAQRLWLALYELSQQQESEAA